MKPIRVLVVGLGNMGLSHARAYQSLDVPKGTVRAAPPVPDDDLTTLRTSLYLVANKKLSNDLATNSPRPS